MKIIVIAAGRGRRLMPTTADAPKCFAEVSGRRLIDWAVDAFAQNGLTDICFIGGYQIDKVKAAYPQFTFRENANWEHRTVRARIRFGDTALIIIDMQRDFVMPGGFGEALGNDVKQLQVTIAPTKSILEGARKAGILVIHTREGHRPDLSDCPPSKLVRGRGRRASAMADRWDAFWCAVRSGMTSCPSSIRSPAKS